MATISYPARHRSEQTDIWQGRVTSLAASAVVTLPIAAKEIIAVQFQAVDGTPNVIWKPNTARTKAFYCLVGSDESGGGFDVTVWYTRGTGASVTVGNTGTTTTTTTTTTAG